MKRLLLLLVLCAGCGAGNISTQENLSRTISNAQDIEYIVDHKTGLCFAVHDVSGYYGMVCVPCDSLKRIKSIVK